MSLLGTSKAFCLSNKLQLSILHKAIRMDEFSMKGFTQIVKILDWKPRVVIMLILSSQVAPVIKTPPSVTAWSRHQMDFFRVTGLFWGESTGDRRIPLKKASDAELFIDLRLNKWLSKQSRRRWFETPSHSLWRHFNGWRQHWHHDDSLFL